MYCSLTSDLFISLGFHLHHSHSTSSLSGLMGVPSSGGVGNVGGGFLASQLNQLSRYLVDLLKNQPGTKLMFQRFIPAYHHQFGSQLRLVVRLCTSNS